MSPFESPSMTSYLTSIDTFVRQQLGKSDTAALSNISAAMVSVTVTRNLGLLLDQELSMGDHITKLSQVCFFHLRRIRVVRHSLTRNALLTLVHAFVCSRLDFCNNVMFGLWSALVLARSSAVDPKRRCLTHPPDPQVQLHLIGDP